MTGDISIRAENISKVYKLYSSPLDRLKESLHPLRRQYHHDFFALKGVSFEIHKGESVGIIGRNGSGKSTLLKILTGVLTHTSGSVSVNGNVSALLELGAGFNPELSGLENVYFNGMLMGYTREEMGARLEGILSFADIGEYVYQPVKTYSSGMFVRLAFAVAVNVEPEIMIVDEALSVGDAIFQQKCVKKMDSFKNEGGTLIFVSHDMNSIKVLCENAILLDKGEIVEKGPAESVVNMYNSLIASKEGTSIAHKNGKSLEHGNFKVKIVNSEIMNEHGVHSGTFTSGENIAVKVTVRASCSVHDVVIGVLIRDRFGQDIFGINSKQFSETVSLDVGQEAVFNFNVLLSLGIGSYTLTVAAHSGDTHLDDNYHWCDSVKAFDVVFGSTKFAGLANLDTSCVIEYLK